MAGWSAPVVLASGVENPAGVTVVSGKLYWVNENDSTIRSLGANGTFEPTAGGGAVAYTLVSPARQLLGNGDHLFARVTKGSTVLIDTTTPDPDGGVPALYSDVSVTAIALIDGYYFLGGSSDNHGCSGAGAGLQVNYGTSYPWSTYTTSNERSLESCTIYGAPWVRTGSSRRLACSGGTPSTSPSLQGQWPLCTTGASSDRLVSRERWRSSAYIPSTPRTPNS